MTGSGKRKPDPAKLRNDFENSASCVAHDVHFTVGVDAKGADQAKLRGPAQQWCELEVVTGSGFLPLIQMKTDRINAAGHVIREKVAAVEHRVERRAAIHIAAGD